MENLLTTIFIVIIHIAIISNSQTLNVVCGQNSRLETFKTCMAVNGIPSDSIIDQYTNSTLYSQVNYRWNLRIPAVDPLAYFLPISTSEVQIAVRCAAESDISIIPKSGGHSYESFSFGTPDTIVVAFRRMGQIEVDQTQKTAVIQPGALIGHVEAKLWEDGGFGLPMGLCPTVGIGGHALGGGAGYFSTMYGLVLDNVLEMTMVDSTGVAHTVNEVQNPDLFWALRGVGSGFIGFVTSFKFKLFDASKIKMSFVKIRYSLAHAADVLLIWQRWITWTEENEPNIFSCLDIRDDFLELQTVHIQDASIQPKGNETFLQMVYHMNIAKYGNMSLTYPSYMEFVKENLYVFLTSNTPKTEIDLANLRSEHELPRFAKVKAYYVSKIFDSDSLQTVAEMIQRKPNNHVWAWFGTEGGFHRKVSVESTAYIHRTSLYSVEIHYEGSDNPADVAEGMAWIQDFMNVTKFMDNKESYQSFVDRDLKNYNERYYGANFERLVNIKSKWDPKNIFRNHQSLPVQVVKCDAENNVDTCDNSCAHMSLKI